MFTVVIITINVHYLLNLNELEMGAKQSVDHTIGVQDVLTTMQTTLSLFKTLTNFILPEFEELIVLIVPTIKSHV
jgi:hypothetical protein